MTAQDRCSPLALQLPQLPELAGFSFLAPRSLRKSRIFLLQTLCNSLQLPPKLQRPKTPQVPGLQTSALPTHDLLTLFSGSSCHRSSFCIFPCLLLRWIASWLLLLMGWGLPLNPSSGSCHTRVTSSAPTWASFVVATATHSQRKAICEQLQLPAVRLCTACVLYPAVLCSDSYPHTSLSSSSDLVRKLEILKGGLVFFFLKKFSPH